ncbi:MAG: NADH-quinone oxidoreductase subunit N [Armatimonadetes bacterium]|nr:NADH-quinone oxidoreductase subunit N [Armatimonadota bacterium]
MPEVTFPLPDIDLISLRPLIIVLGTALVLLIAELFMPKSRNQWLAGLGIFGLLAAGLSQVTIWDVSIRSFGGMMVTDQFSAMLNLILIGATILAFLFADDYLTAKNIHLGEFYPMMLFATAGAMVMVSSTDLIIIFLGLEILSIALYVLTGFARSEVRSEEAALKYFLLGAFASAFFLYGIAMIFGATGGADLTNIASSWTENEGGRSLLIAGMALLLVGLAFKTALVPFHMWTPDVYQGAPTVVTAYMSAVSKAAAVAVLVRTLGQMYPMKEIWEPALTVIAIASMTLGNLAAIVQRDAKRMLAYSSIAHAGYLMVGMISGNVEGLTGIVYYLVAYSLMSIGAFAVLTLMARAGDDTSLDGLKGLWHRQPVAAAAMLVMLFSLTGIPPSAGFFGKWHLLIGAVQANYIWLAVVLVINSVIGAGYYLNLIRSIYIDSPAEEGAKPWAIPAGLGLCILICAVGLIVFGITPYLADASRHAVERMALDWYAMR